MKKILRFAFIAFGINACLQVGTAKAQITFEHDYDSASTVCHGSPCIDDQLMIINFEVSGDRYVKINRDGKYISVYDLNHTLVKKIDCSGLPMIGINGFFMGYILYLSENLFSTDSKIAFMYGFEDQNATPTTYYTGIYNEDGALLFSDTAGVPIVDVNIPQQQFPIYNTPNGTKMILSYTNGHAKVFSLPGSLTSCCNTENIISLAEQRRSSVSNAYPNPTNISTRIDYELPNGINEGEIVFYNLMGTEIKRFKVDRTFSTLLVSTKELAAGTYYYQLQTTGDSSGGKKMVVIK
jgi:hypothetical protein